MLKHPRERNEKFLTFIRTLICVRCKTDFDIHAAHIRYADSWFGKRQTGAGRKPDDRWAVPLCVVCHVFGQDAQHTRGEKVWWKTVGVNPILLSALLFSHFSVDDREAAIQAIQRAILITPWSD